MRWNKSTSIIANCTTVKNIKRYAENTLRNLVQPKKICAALQNSLRFCATQKNVLRLCAAKNDVLLPCATKYFLSAFARPKILSANLRDLTFLKKKQAKKERFFSARALPQN